MAGRQRRLGCLEDIQAFATDLCGSPRVCDFSNASLIEFNRILNSISEARIEVPLSDPECCECLKDLWPWCHELHILRNGETVWQGVIKKVTYTPTKAIIEARDMLHWLTVRDAECPVDTRDNPVDVATLAETVINLALADGDPCISQYLEVVDTDLPEVGILLPAFEESAFQQLEDLAALGLSFTTIGRRIVVGGPNLFSRHIGLLSDEFLLGEYEVSKDGDLYANRVFVRYGGDDDPAQCAAQGATGACLPAEEGDGSACPAICETDEEDMACFGRVERIIDIGKELAFSTAQQTACIYIDAGGRFVPIVLEMPPGTRLSPDTPWDFNDMVPGMLIDVALTELCLDVFQSMRLQELSYRLDFNGEEEIGVTLSPLNLITGQV